MPKYLFIYRGKTEGGTRRVIENLLKEFDHIESSDWVLLTDKKECIGRYQNIEVVYKRGGKNILDYLIWDYLKSFFFILRHKDLKSIFYSKGSIPLSHILFKVKKVYMVYDLGYFEKDLNAYTFKDTFFMKWQMILSCHIANTIIAISEFTKNEIIRKFKVDTKKIKVVYLGVETKFKKENDNSKIKEVLTRLDIKQPFLFYSGSVSPRKNLLRSLESFNSIKDDIPHSFIMTGRAKWGNTGVGKFIEKNDLRDRVMIVGHVSEEDLLVLYSAADLVVFPSLYEGFGLPILEAQACGCPVLASNVASMPEIIGNKDYLVNPYSVTDITSKTMEMLNNQNLIEKLIKGGYDNVKKFQWKETARLVMEEM